MKNYFGKDVAERYDDNEPIYDPAVIELTVSFLTELARDDTALEMGIGTGRIALPLSRKGINTHGIELSPDMVKQLQAKPGADSIKVTLGDFASTKVKGTFQLVFLIFNTITNLTTQDAQIECFCNAASHLKPGGFFVIENFIPALRLLPPGQIFYPYQFNESRFDFDEYDVSTQGLISHHYRKVDGVLHGHSVPFRYVWPSELDLMAKIAGLELYERWSYWDKQQFTNESTSHISVWKKPV